MDGQIMSYIKPSLVLLFFRFYCSLDGNKWVHNKSNELSNFDFRQLQNNKDFLYCIKCIPHFFSILHKQNKPNIYCILGIYQNLNQLY